MNVLFSMTVSVNDLSEYPLFATTHIGPRVHVMFGPIFSDSQVKYKISSTTPNQIIKLWFHKEEQKMSKSQTFALYFMVDDHSLALQSE